MMGVEGKREDVGRSWKTYLGLSLWQGWFGGALRVDWRVTKRGKARNIGTNGFQKKCKKVLLVNRPGEYQ